MGAFYTNVSVRTPVGEWNVLEAQDVQGLDAAIDWAKELTAVKTVALAADLHDSDILSLAVIRDGELLGTYNSYPNYFSDDEDRQPPVGLPGGLLVEALGVTADPTQVESILRFAADIDDGDDPYLFEEARHEALLDVLGLPR